MPLITGLTKSAADAAYLPRFPKVVATLLHPSAFGLNVLTPGANGGFGGRVVMPATGTINAIAVFNLAVVGNLDIGIYDTSATTRNRLVSSGSTVMGAANSWQAVTVSLAVNAGDHVDLACSVSGASQITGTSGQATNLSVLPSGWMVAPLGGLPIMNWFAAAIFPLPATISEGTINGSTSSTPLIIARYA